MARLSYGELRARLGLSNGRRASAEPSVDLPSLPGLLWEYESVLADRRTVRLEATPVEKELASA